MPVCDFPILPDGKRICYNSNGINLQTKVQESAGSVVGDKHQSGCSPMGEMATPKSSFTMCLMAGAY